MDTNTRYDYIVIGTGITGIQAAETLLDAGKDVLVLDVGFRDESNIRFPDGDFITIRKTVSEQHKLFLGEHYEGIPWGKIKTGSQLTPSRKYLVKGIEKWLAVLSNNFFPYESLAYGGLGNAWGAGCYMFSEEEFKKIGLGREAFMKSYRKVAERVGLTQPDPEGEKYSVEDIPGLMPPLNMEESMQKVYGKYLARKSEFNERGFTLARPSMAIRTETVANRQALLYEDMEFWQDNRKSVYRTGQAFDELSKRIGLTLITGQLVLTFREHDSGVDVECIDINTSAHRVFRCKKLVSCAGVLGTARIVLRSFQSDAKLPLLCNPYSYVPMLNVGQLGKVSDERKFGMGQLVMYYDPKKDNSDVSMAALFTYRSLLLFRLIKETPLNFSDGRILQQFLAPALVIAGIHHSESPGVEKYLQLKKDNQSPTGDVLAVNYTFIEEERAAIREKEKQYFKAFRKLGCYPVRRVDPGTGSSIHYAGCLPFSDIPQPFTTAINGKLHGTRNVFIADGSSFKYLPAKGISFTLMANAERVASESLLQTD